MGTSTKDRLKVWMRVLPVGIAVVAMVRARGRRRGSRGFCCVRRTKLKLWVGVVQRRGKRERAWWWGFYTCIQCKLSKMLKLWVERQAGKHEIRAEPSTRDLVILSAILQGYTLFGCGWGYILRRSNGGGFHRQRRWPGLAMDPGSSCYYQAVSKHTVRCVRLHVLQVQGTPLRGSLHTGSSLMGSHLGQFARTMGLEARWD